MKLTDIIVCKLWEHAYACTLCGSVEPSPACGVVGTLVRSGRPICRRCHESIIPPELWQLSEEEFLDDPEFFMNDAEVTQFRARCTTAETYAAQVESLLSANAEIDGETALQWAYVNLRSGAPKGAAS